MIINLSKFLSSEENSFKYEDNFVIDDEEFLAKTHLNKIVAFNGTFFKVENSVLLTGNVSYTYHEVCARCLIEFDKAIDAKIEAVIVRKIEDDEDNEFDEIRLIIEDGCVNLDEAVKQIVYLSMPMKSVCKSDCKGICPTCGVNLNVQDCKCKKETMDSRFDKLKDLFKD